MGKHNNTHHTPNKTMSTTHTKQNFYDTELSVFTWKGESFFVGVQMANLLKRETFNMYRSMKIKNISIRRATSEQVNFLIREQAVRAGTHSVTLVPYESGINFMAEAQRKLKRKTAFTKRKSTRSSKRKSSSSASSSPSNSTPSSPASSSPPAPKRTETTPPPTPLVTVPFEFQSSLPADGQMPQRRKPGQTRRAIKKDKMLSLQAIQSMRSPGKRTLRELALAAEELDMVDSLSRERAAAASKKPKPEEALPPISEILATSTNSQLNYEFTKFARSVVASF